MMGEGWGGDGGATAEVEGGGWAREEGEKIGLVVGEGGREDEAYNEGRNGYCHLITPL